MRKRISNEDKDFYKYLGVIFGSRNVERATKDRFYDDPGKVWLVHTMRGGKVDSAVGFKDRVIKNVYCENEKETIVSLKEIYGEVVSGIVPAVYRNLYEEAGFQIAGEQTKNFVQIRGGKSDE